MMEETNADIDDIVVRAEYGIPTIDGVASPGEYSVWTNLTLTLKDVLRCNPPSTLNISLAVKNTAANLYVIVIVPNRLPPNESTASPPYHNHGLYLFLDDNITKIVNNHTYLTVKFGFYMTSPTDVQEYSVFHTTPGPVYFVDEDSSKPWGNATFTPSLDVGIKGTETFEMVFPLTVLPAMQSATGDLINMGLRPVARYRVINLDFASNGHNGEDTYSYRYRIPPYGADYDFWIETVFDPIPTFLFVSTIIIFAAIVLISFLLWRRKRKRQQTQQKETG